MTIALLHGDCRELLTTLPAASVQMCVTSPPYWQLRDYGTPGQIGMEASVDEYVDALVSVFREVKRALRDDGTLWVNLGDAYAGGGRNAGNSKPHPKGYKGLGHLGDTLPGPIPPGLKEKDLIGLPWLVAFALRADGWYLRSDIIWEKGNCMPESVTDRPTRSHEYLFLLSKSRRYFYDTDAIREPYNDASIGRYQYRMDGTAPTSRQPGGDIDRRKRESSIRNPNPAGRNRRSVWRINSQPYRDAHYAVFPEKLPELCILAGSRPGDTVLDPFVGSGTTCRVAERLGRDSIGIDLAYQELQEKRTDGVQKMIPELL